MPGYDDPRYLQQVITDLQRRMKKLEGDVLPFAIHQQGPIPGFMKAVTVGDPGLKSSMWLNLSGQRAGRAPYQAVADANGVIRAEIGNLAANGVSPAQFGFRANDASGNPIFDSLGLIAVMQQLGRGDNTAGQTFTTTTPTLFTGVTTTFSLPRAIRVLALCQAAGNATTNTGRLDLFVDGVNTVTPGDNTAGEMNWGVGGPTVTSNTFYSATLSAGSHTLELRGFLTATPGSLFANGGTIIVYGLGS